MFSRLVAKLLPELRDLIYPNFPQWMNVDSHFSCRVPSFFINIGRYFQNWAPNHIIQNFSKFRINYSYQRWIPSFLGKLFTYSRVFHIGSKIIFSLLFGSPIFCILGPKFLLFKILHVIETYYELRSIF